jgi:hypothetical protein
VIDEVVHTDRDGVAKATLRGDGRVGTATVTAHSGSRRAGDHRGRRSARSPPPCGSRSRRRASRSRGHRSSCWRWCATIRGSPCPTPRQLRDRGRHPGFRRELPALRRERRGARHAHRQPSRICCRWATTPSRSASRSAAPGGCRATSSWWRSSARRRASFSFSTGRQHGWPSPIRRPATPRAGTGASATATARPSRTRCTTYAVPGSYIVVLVPATPSATDTANATVVIP